MIIQSYPFLGRGNYQLSIINYPLLNSVTPKSNYKLRLIYSNGSEIIVDFKPILNQGGIFAPLSNPKFFHK